MTRSSDNMEQPRSPTPETPIATSNHHPTPTGMTHRGRIRSTRVGAWWTGSIIAALILVALLIFIAQNSHPVSVHYLGFDGEVSLAVALLLSAVAAALILAIPGTARIVQLRHALKKSAQDTPGGPKRR